MRWRARVVGVLATGAIAIVSAALAPAAARAAARPALFRVGVAIRSIDPNVPVYAGGFSLSPPITKVHDPLEVRAIYITNGRTAVAFDTIDAQGYFAAYQEGAGVGATADRIDAARAASRAGGVPMTSADIIEQATHTHAGPTLEGIWGPVPMPYLRLVHDQAVAAIAAAAAHARPAHLQFATIDDRNIASVDVNQDDPQGWVNDPQISVLRAVSPRTGRTIGLFANVPTHGAQVCGQCLGTLSADYFGAVRTQLDHELGGVSVVGPATLGREESPVETTGFRNMYWLAHVIANDVTEALGQAHWITSDRLAARQTSLDVVATNPVIVGLNNLWSLSPSGREAFAEKTGEYPIDRSVSPPYRRSGDVYGTVLTSIRLGDIAYASMPGEPWPEVRLTIQRAVPGATVVALSKAQDDFGYFYPAYDEAFPELYDSDNALFDVAPQMGDQAIHEEVSQLGRLGFATKPALEGPLPNRYSQIVSPGLQTLASPSTGDAGPHGTFTTTLQAIYMPAFLSDRPLDGAVHWSFGDGTSASTGYLSVGQDYSQTGQGNHGNPYVRHAFRPGRYTVTASGIDTGGQRVAWTITVHVFPRLRVQASCPGGVPRAVVTGGEGTVLRETWSRRGARRRVVVLDAAGGRASARTLCR